MVLKVFSDCYRKAGKICWNWLSWYCYLMIQMICYCFAYCRTESGFVLSEAYCSLPRLGKQRRRLEAVDLVEVADMPVWKLLLSLIVFGFSKAEFVNATSAHVQSAIEGPFKDDFLCWRQVPLPYVQHVDLTLLQMFPVSLIFYRQWFSFLVLPKQYKGNRDYLITLAQNFF